MTRPPMRVAVRRWSDTAVGRGRRLLLPACVLAFGIVGWEHLYHTMYLGHSETLAGHATHVLRDAALAMPLAVAALHRVRKRFVVYENVGAGIVCRRRPRPYPEVRTG